MQGDQTAVTPPCRRHGRDFSELDVFDASRYFSDGTDAATAPSDRPIKAKIFDSRLKLKAEVKESPVKDEGSKKSFKQPASPGIRLASFFYSLFSPSSKKKMKEKSLQDVGSDEGRRRSSRRGSSPLEPGKYRKSKFDEALWRLRRGETEKKMTRVRNCGEEKAVARAAENRKGEGRMENDNDSDSSSDLFELKSFDLGAPFFELPVFGSTGAGGYRRRASSSSSHTHSAAF